MNLHFTVNYEADLVLQSLKLMMVEGILERILKAEYVAMCQGPWSYV